MVKDYKTSSQYDPGQVLKHAHDDRAKALKVIDANSQVPGGFTKVSLTTNALGSVTKALFYAGVTAEKTRIKFSGDVAGSLSGKYFLLNSGEDTTEFYVWYNTGSSVNPAIPGKCGIEVFIQPNDPAGIVTMATRMTLEVLEHFYVESNGNDVLLINNVKMGMTTPTVDVNTGFFITQSTEGSTSRIKCIDLPIESDFIYKFNEGERKFELIYTGQSTGNLGKAPTIQNIVASLANTEYSFVIPQGTKKYRFRVRNSVPAKLQYAFNSGESDTLFMTVMPGNIEEDTQILLEADLTLYFRVTKENQIIELLTWI